MIKAGLEVETNSVLRLAIPFRQTAAGLLPYWGSGSLGLRAHEGARGL